MTVTEPRLVGSPNLEQVKISGDLRKIISAPFRAMTFRALMETWLMLDGSAEGAVFRLLMDLCHAWAFLKENT
jgi:hypothetical protein